MSKLKSNVGSMRVLSTVGETYSESVVSSIETVDVSDNNEGVYAGGFSVVAIVVWEVERKWGCGEVVAIRFAPYYVS